MVSTGARGISTVSPEIGLVYSCENHQQTGIQWGICSNADLNRTIKHGWEIAGQSSVDGEKSLEENVLNVWVYGKYHEAGEDHAAEKVTP